MLHCCKFKPDDVYYLKDTNLYVYRMLSIGFCPICGKPVAELFQWRFDGISERQSAVGIKANDLMRKLKDEIIYSMTQVNYRKMKGKPFGWKYGENKSNKKGYKQYACDFYGNKELVKTIING